VREKLELRVREEYAPLLFSKNEGTHLGDSIRKVVLDSSDPRLDQVAEFQKEYRRLKRRFFSGWIYHREYSERELASAPCFTLETTAVFEPAGEDCGTLYDEHDTCAHVFTSGETRLPGRQPIKWKRSCGAGARQISDLTLDFRKIPKNKDIARTIAHEWIVSQQLADLLLDSRMTGFELRPVRHKSRFEDDPLVLESLGSGRELLRRAEEHGIARASWEFDVWINQAEQRQLMHNARQESTNMKHEREVRKPQRFPARYQLVVTSDPVGVAAPPTQFGTEPFNYDREGVYRCPFGHIAGLNLLSEVTIKVGDWRDGGDILRTKEMVGVREGVLRPHPILLISPRLYKLLRRDKVKGFQVEVAHLA